MSCWDEDVNATTRLKVTLTRRGPIYLPISQLLDLRNKYVSGNSNGHQLCGDSLQM